LTQFILYIIIKLSGENNSMTQKETIILNAKTRQETGKKVKQLREAGKLPAVLYGHNVENLNLVLNYSDFEKALNQVGESSLIDLKIDEHQKPVSADGGAQPVKVLIQDVTRHPVSDKILHVDFYQVKMDEKIRTEVELNFVNEAPAVKELGGVLVKVLDHIEIECLPSDLISELEVDLSSLKTFDDIIRVKDLKVSEKVNILTDTEATVALVEEPSKVEEEKPAEEEKPEGEEGEEKEEKKEGGEKEEAKEEDKGKGEEQK